MQLQLFSIFLTVLSLYATQIFAYITDLKLVSCDAKHACPNYPGYRKIDINLNKGVKKGNSVYLHFKESTIDDPITDIKIEQGTNYTSAPNISKWTRLSVDLNERKDASNDASASLWLSYTKDKTVSKNPITSIIVKEGTSPLVGAEYKRIPVDLNKDVHGSYLFMYYSQDGPKDPITAITAKQCFTSNCYMEGWERVEKDLNRGIVVGMSVYLFYKRSRTDDPVTDAVVILNDQTPPEGYTKVDVNLNSIFRGDAIYLWYRTTPLTNSDVAKKAIQELAIEFGAHTMTPYGWTKINVDLNSGNNGKGTVGEPTFLYMKKGYKDLPNMKPLAFDKNGDFKILQIADLHFTNEEGVCRDVPADTECNGDMTTLKYIEKLLDHEKPDLVVFSGDNIDGAGVSDARAATFKFADPVIQRKIPWAVVFGEHDDESDLSREELIEVMRRMPYSLIQRGPMDIPGWGNYAVKVFESTQKAAPHAFTLYFLDSHSYAETKEGFDFIKSYQLDWIVKSASVFRETSNSKLNAGVFFHIPIWDYREETNTNKPSAILGSAREHVSSPGKNKLSAIEAFKLGDVKFTACGHNHVNDYCLEKEGLQLCYAGGAGVGGYGAEHLGWHRRARIFLLSDYGNTIRTWKRQLTDDLPMIHFQTLYSA